MSPQIAPPKPEFFLREARRMAWPPATRAPAAVAPGWTPRPR